MTLSEPARAKLNLALHVRRKRDDGYHDLETLFAFCEAGDVVTAEQASDVSLTIAGPFAAGLDPTADNLVTKAAHALRTASGRRAGAALHLTKNLPVASGIGGGSADAAATLRLLNRLWGLEWSLERLAEIGATLGADVAACVWSRTLRGEGRGEQLRPVDATMLAGKPVLLVNPGVAVPTGAVYAAWDGIDRGPFADNDFIGRNDLEAPARTLQPVIGRVLDLLAAQPGARVVSMSGSGATCFALFDTEAASAGAASAISSTEPGWWVAASRLV